MTREALKEEAVRKKKEEADKTSLRLRRLLNISEVHPKPEPIQRPETRARNHEVFTNRERDIKSDEAIHERPDVFRIQPDIPESD